MLSVFSSLIINYVRDESKWLNKFNIGFKKTCRRENEVKWKVFLVCTMM